MCVSRLSEVAELAAVQYYCYPSAKKVIISDSRKCKFH